MKVRTLQRYMSLCREFGRAPSIEDLKRYDRLTQLKLKGGAGHDVYRRAV